MDYLDFLEMESIHILREVVAEARRPVMLYSIGKDSSVMLHLALKAFHPGGLPFPLLHIDTTWKFREMISFRDKRITEVGAELLIHVNEIGAHQGMNPFKHGSQTYTAAMKTEALKQALNRYKFDAAFGGARRDEEKSRAKERILSFRDSEHQWDPRHQRPEVWNLYNGRVGSEETIRAFPLSNWTELDIWQYIQREGIRVVPLYFAKTRPMVERSRQLIMVDDGRLPLLPGESPCYMQVRFRTLGCYPLTGGIKSNADTIEKIVQEMEQVRTSERQGRMIDHDDLGSMEQKKRQGYF